MFSWHLGVLYTHYLLVLQVHIAVEVNFYTFCALCKKDKNLSFSHLYVLFAL